jgi:hypothetical protein
VDIKRRRNKTVMSIVGLFVVAVLVTAGTLGYFWYRKAQTDQTANTSSNGGSISLNSEEKIETEKIETALVIPKSTDKAGDTINVSVLSLTAPKSWRTVNGKNLLNTPLEGVYATSYNDILAQLIMVPETKPTDPIQALNNLSFYNITSWLAKPSAGVGGTVSPAAKAAYIQNLINIADGKPTDKKACDKGYGVLNTGLCGTLLKATPLATADGKLKGVIFLNTMTQSVSYDPQAIVFLTGQVKDQQLLAYGIFHLLDNASHSISATDTESIKAAWESFAAGTVSSDTLKLYQNVIDAMKSIQLKAN